MKNLTVRFLLALAAQLRWLRLWLRRSRNLDLTPRTSAPAAPDFGPGRFAAEAARASARRHLRHAVRQAVARNTRGLPKGFRPSALRACDLRRIEAKGLIRNALKRGAFYFGLRHEQATELRAAVTRSEQVRAVSARPSKIARRVGRNRQSCSANRWMVERMERRIYSGGVA